MGKGWIPAPVFTRVGSTREKRIGRATIRVEPAGPGMDFRRCLYGGRLYAGMTGVGAGRATTRVAPTEEGIKGKGILCWG